MSNHSDEIETIELETEDSEGIEMSVELENLVSDEELTLAHISENETELFEIDFDKIWSEDLNDDESFNGLFWWPCSMKHSSGKSQMILLKSEFNTCSFFFIKTHWLNLIYSKMKPKWFNDFEDFTLLINEIKCKYSRFF